jgi:hypothetical protein
MHPTQCASSFFEGTGYIIIIAGMLLCVGHCELARRTGATIYFGPGAASRTQFTIHEMKDGEVCGGYSYPSGYIIVGSYLKESLDSIFAPNDN